MHKLIKREITEFIVPDNQEEVKKILGKEMKEEKKEEAEDDFTKDYDEGMDEFMDSLGGSHKEEEKLKTGEIRALG